MVATGVAGLFDVALVLTLLALLLVLRRPEPKLGRHAIKELRVRFRLLGRRAACTNNRPKKKFTLVRINTTTNMTNRRRRRRRC